MPEDPLNLYFDRRAADTFSDVIEAHGARALQAAYRVLGDRAAAEDAAHETFVRILDAKPDTGPIRSPAAYVTTMAVNAARTRLRAERRRAVHEEAAATRREAAMATALGREAIGEVRDAVAALPAPLREAVELRYFGSLGIDAVAEALGVARRTVHDRLKEARDRLRKRLGGADYAPVLAGLAGEADGAFPEAAFPETAFPETAVTARYRRRLESLVRRSPAPKPRTASRTVRIGAGFVATAVVIALWLTFGPGRDGARPSPQRNAHVGPVHPAPTTGSVAGQVAVAPPGESDSGDLPSGDAKDEAPTAVPGRPGAGLVVTVVDENGERLSSGSIQIGLVDLFPPPEVATLLKPFEKYLERQSLEDANPLVIEGLPDVVDGMEFTLEVQAVGRPPTGRIPIALEKGKVLERRIELSPAAEISVVVTDRVTEKPVAGAAVVSVTEQSRRDRVLHTVQGRTTEGAGVTDAEGRVVLGGLGSGPHEIAVTAEGYRETGIEAVGANSKVAVALEPIVLAGAVAVVVTDPAGAPVPGVRVALQVEGGATKRMEKTDEAGRSRFEDVPPGFHSVSFAFDDWFEVLKANDWFREEGQVLYVTVPLKAGEEAVARIGFRRGSALVTGRVVGPDGRPAKGIEVTIGGAVQKSAITDGEGRVEFRDLPDGTYHASLADQAVGWDWSLPDEWTLAAGETRDFTWTAGRAVVRGRIRRPDGSAPEGRMTVAMSGPAFDMRPADGKGAFAFRGVPPGEYELTVATDEFASPDVRVTVPADGDPAPVTIDLVCGGRILVDFRPEDRAALVGARIDLTDAAGELLNLDRDESGEHDRRTGPLVPGEYRLRVSVGDGEPRVRAVEIEDGKDSRVVLENE